MITTQMMEAMNMKTKYIVVVHEDHDDDLFQVSLFNRGYYDETIDGVGQLPADVDIYDFIGTLLENEKIREVVEVYFLVDNQVWKKQYETLPPAFKYSLIITNAETWDDIKS